jgi:vitellogenic carboxypeptidase-like protein
MKIQISTLLISIFIIVPTTINAIFINPYPRYQALHPAADEDFGEPLFLTPFIKAGNIKLARTLANVSHPEMDALGIKSYSGYLTVDEKHNSNLFFWFFEAKMDAAKAPVVLWLQGGPGASSMFGLFTENGPFWLKTATKLSPRKYSWHLNHNLIYIDNPVGTGFSFTDDGYSKNEKEVGHNLYEGLKQFFTLFEELQPNDFFVTGESYAGKYVPAVSYTIHEENKRKENNPKINLQGLAIGNGFCDPLHQIKYGDYLFQLGLIDLNSQTVFHEYEQKGKEFIEKREFDKAFDIFDALIDMDEYPQGSLFRNLTGFSTYFNYLLPNGDDAAMYLSKFLQSAAVRKAIHVGNNTFHDTDVENKVEEHLKLDIWDSIAPWLGVLIDNYRVVIYNGQLDIIVAYPLTIEYLHLLNFDRAAEYRTAPREIWRVDTEIAGFAKTAGNLTEILVRNAGHMVK